MSTTVDSKVVEMRFDNKHFENNVSTTMSTLDKLKQKLRLDGASRGLETLNATSKKVNFSEMEYAATRAGFQIQDVWLKTASVLEYQIARRIIDIGKRMTAALTIDPIKTGFQEYETQINAVQTIMANTEKEMIGLTEAERIAKVNGYLDELNRYADKTIYNFTEMTRNIGTFTAAGVDLDTSVNAIQGIANLAAVSGSTSQQASTAMYQLSQALSSGTVKLMDWNSVVNAGMGGQVFQDALKETARVHGVAIDSMIESEGSFRETLKDGWLTSEILTETLQKFTLTTEGLNEEQIEANREMLRAKGYTEEQIDAIFQLGNTATDAATKVKTFTQLWDVLKESAQSGWSQTWKLIVGDFAEARALLTPLADMLTGFINRMSEWRNRVLQIALDFASPWTAMIEKINKVTDAVGNIGDKIANITGSLEYFQDIVNKVWRGDYNNWGDNPDRFDLLTEAGYDWRVVQDLVNLGYRYKLTMEDIEASHRKFGLTMETTTEETEEITDAINSLTDEQLKNAGLTEDEIRLYRALEKEANRLGITISELGEEMANNNGRDMLIESAKNIGGMFIDLGQAAKTAWIEVFNPPNAEELGIRLYGIIRSLRDFTQTLRMVDEETGELNEKGQKFQRVFKGIFAAVDIVLTVVGGPLRIAFKILTQLLSVFGVGVLDVAAFVGDVIVKFDQWLNAVLDFTAIFEKMVTPVKNAIASFREWIETLKESENLPQDIANGIASGFGKAFRAVRDFFKNLPTYFKNGFSELGDSPLGGFIAKLKYGLGIAGQTIVALGKIVLDKINGFLSAKGFKTISEDSIAGLVNGFKDGASKVWNAAVNMAKTLVQKVKDFLGIHSPSKVFMAIGGFIIAGLVAGLKNGAPNALGGIQDVFQPMLDWISTIDFGAIFAGVIGLATAATGWKAVSALSSVASMFEGVGELLGSCAIFVKKLAGPIKQVVKGFAKIEKAVAFNLRMDGVKTLVTSLVMLVAAIVVLTFIDTKKLWSAVLIILALSAILVGLVFAMNKINDASASFSFKEGMSIKSLSSGLIGIGAAILLIGMTVKMLGKLNPEQAEQGMKALLGVITAVGALLIAFMKIPFGPDDAVIITNLGKTMKQIGIALLLMAVVTKILGKMDRGELVQGGIAITAFAGIMVGLMAATKLISGSKHVDSIGKTLFKIGLAFVAMAIAVKILGKMDRGELIQGGIAIAAFSGIIIALMAATKLISGSKNIDTIGKTLFKIGLAFVAMAVVVKILGKMDRSELIQGTLAIAAFGGIIVGLMAATKLISGSKNIGKIGGAILAISGAIAIMAFTAFMLSMVSWEGFAKGTLMITAFGGIIVGLMAATKLVGNDADKIGKTIISIAAAIGILGLVAVLLSLVPTENLIKGVIVVAALAAIVAGLIAVTKNAKDCWATVLAMAGLIAVLAGALWVISTIPVDSLLPSAIALGGLLLVLTGVLAVLNIIGATWTNAALGVAALGILIGAMAVLGLVLVVLNALNITDAIPNAIALSVLCTVLTVLLIPLSLIGMLVSATGGVILLGVVALLSMAIPLLAFVGVIALMSGIQNGIANAQALTELMAVIGDVLFKISLVAPLAVVGVVALNAMVGLMTMLGVVATAIGALVTKFPQLQTFLDTGIPILERLAGSLGSIIGSFIAGFAGAVMTILPQLGLCLSQFMVNATPFIVGAKMIDGSVLTGVGILAGAVVVLTAADLIAGVTSFLQGGSSFADLGTQLSQFMTNAMPFITGAAMITPDAMTGVKALAETILIITAANVLEGLTSFITGGSSLENFAKQLPILGQGLSAFSASLGTFTEDQLNTVNCAANAVKTLAQASSEIPNAGGLLAAIVGENELGAFASQFPILGSGLAQFLTNVGTFSEEQVATVECAAKAIKTLAQASSEIPNSGGWLGQIVGENDLGPFAAQFPILGMGLRGFLDNVGTFTEEQVVTVDCAAQAIKALASAASEIPNSGGWIAAIVGENDLGPFAEQFPSLGTGLRGFLDNVGTFTDDQVSTVNCAANAVQALASVASKIPNEGGWISKIVGDNSLGTFADNFPKLGKGLAGFAENLGTFSDGKVASVNAAVRAINALASLASADLKGATKNLSNFGSDLPGFARDISSFCAKMPDVDSVNSAVSGLNKILSAVDSIASANSGALATFADDLSKVGKNAVKKFVEAFTSDSAKTDVKNAAEKLAKKAVNGLETQDGEAKTAGKNLGAGYVKGINAKKQEAYDAGFALGKKAAQGINDGQKSKSPSRLAVQSGKWLGEGYIIGMGKMGGQVDKAGTALGETATNNLSSTISRISDMVNSDIDSQPTIRPVLDLSDVKTGVNAIGGMLNMDSSIGVRANVGSISSMMNNRQNGATSDDVVSAIDKLNKRMDGLGNTTYQINGITYDDGSNITDAVATLVRAAKIERRV